MSDQRSFETTVMPWLDAAYNLARWLLNDENAAEDVVQEASIRAFKYLDSLRGNEARLWFLGIVRNSCFTYLKERKGRNVQFGLEDEALEAVQWKAGDAALDPLVSLERGRERTIIDAAIRHLPPAMRDVFVLREIEGLEYSEIAQIAAIPIGTVMSRLSRARGRLKAQLSQTDLRE